MKMTNFKNINDTINNKIVRGLKLPTTAMAHILNGKDMLKDFNNFDLKSKIHIFINSRDRIFLSDIIEKFNISHEKAIKVLDELEEEKIIRQI